MADLPESIILDEYANAHEYQTAIRTGMSKVWGNHWDDDTELKERVLPAHLMETMDGLVWLAENVMEQARLMNDWVGLLGVSRDVAMNRVFEPIAQEGEKRSVAITAAKFELAVVRIRLCFLRMPMNDGDLMRSMPQFERCVRDLSDALSETEGRRYDGAFWRAPDFSMENWMNDFEDEEEEESDDEDEEEDLYM